MSVSPPGELKLAGLREFGIIMTNAWPEQSGETVQAFVESVSSMQQRDCALSRPAAPPG